MFSQVKIFVPRHSPAKFLSAFAPDSLLSEQHLEKTVEKFAKLSAIKQKTTKSTRNAAVLIPLCVVNQQVSLLYTLRSSDLKSHRSQVSFPGGMQDPADQDLASTALRETEEELGIKQEDIEVYGQGNLLMSRDTTSVLPFVGVIRNKNLLDEIRINPSEVKEVFTVPVQVLCDPAKVKHTQFRSNYTMPVFVGGHRKIWGLTAIITHRFLSCFVPKQFNPRIKYVPPVKKGELPYRLL